MACDSLYGAWLKAYYPYEFYATILKLYTNKGNKDKVTQIINEMRRFAGISLTIGKFGQDNRDWFIDKEKKTISQSLASISFMSPKVAEDLCEAGKNQYETFTDLLWHLLNNTCLNTRQIEILIGLGYFDRFGRTAKLMNVFEEFYKGKNKLTKTIKSYENRLQWNRENEASLRDEDLPIADRVRCECFNTGLCFSHDGSAAGQYIVTDVDDRYRITVTAYNMARGSDSPPLRMKKNTWQAKPLKKGDCILLHSSDVKKKPRYNFKDGVSTIVPDAFDWWLESYQLLPEEKIAKSA